MDLDYSMVRSPVKLHQRFLFINKNRSYRCGITELKAKGFWYSSNYNNIPKYLSYNFFKLLMQKPIPEIKDYRNQYIRTYDQVGTLSERKIRHLDWKAKQMG